MDWRTLTRLLIKVAGAAVIVWSIIHIGQSVSYVLQMNSQGVSPWVIALAALFPTGIPLVVGVVLLTFPGKVSNTLIYGEEFLDTPSKTMLQVERIVYSLLGLYLVISAISDGIYHYARLRLYKKIVEDQSYAGAPALLPDDFGRILATGAELVLGLFLIFGATGLVKLFRRIRGRDDAT
jgi:hypothetical protein